MITRDWESREMLLRAAWVADGIMFAASLIFALSTADRPVIRAEEHGNVTLTWLFPLEADAPRASLYIDIWSVKLVRSIYLYDNLHQPKPYLDQLYRGRVRCDLELAQQGRIECVFSDLRLDDSGTYVCIAVFDQEGSNSGTQHLMVTESNRHTSEPVSQWWVVLYVFGGLSVAMATTLTLLRCFGLLGSNNETPVGQETSCEQDEQKNISAEEPLVSTTNPGDP